MLKSKPDSRSNSSVLGLRLWNFTGTALLNLFVFLLLIAFLSPLSYMIVTSLKTSNQLLDPLAPIWPAVSETFTYQGKKYDVYQVPTESGVRSLALITPKRQVSTFIDPAHPEAGTIQWKGYWRTLNRTYTTKIFFGNFSRLWKSINYAQVLRNTLALVVLGGIGVLFSSIAVAYGFSRLHIPGGKYLFFLLIATIMIPDSILLLPSFVIFTRVLGWNGSFLPLIVPQFFGSAVYIFLLRQNFKSIPRELDEAAMLDGAGPLRILLNIILPQSIPVVTTVALLHFFNTWNELRMASLYLGIRRDLQPISFTSQAFQVYGFTPEILQTSTLLMLVIPIVVLFLAQRFFMQDMVVTGLEK